MTPPDSDSSHALTDDRDLSGDISRREALSRTALLLGGALAASSIAGAGASAAWAAAPRSRTRTLSAAQSDLVAALAEHIIPRTDTPGARDAGVHRFVDAMLTDYYAQDERRRFLDGLADVDVRARAAHGSAFLQLTPSQQIALLTALDAEAYPPRRALERGWFFRRMKELTLLGYYTSEAGAMRELRVNPMGIYRSDVPYGSVGHSWA